MLTIWYDVIPAVEKVLTARFPDLGEDRCRSLAEEFYDDWRPAVGLQQIERSDKAPEKDVEELKKLADDLRKAASRAAKLGWHGAKAVMPLASEMLPKKYQPFYRYADFEAPELLEAYLRSLERACSEAAKGIPKDAGSPMEILGLSRRESRPPDRAASSAVERLFRIFKLATGHPPRRRSNAYDDGNGKEHSPFRELVVEVFAVLGIDAKPDHHIRQVISAAKSL